MSALEGKTFSEKLIAAFGCIYDNYIKAREEKLRNISEEISKFSIGAAPNGYFEMEEDRRLWNTYRVQREAQPRIILRGLS